MKLFIGLLFVALIYGTSAKSLLCKCEYAFQPVCASDGLTYSNPCTMQCASDSNVLNKLPALKLTSPGHCPKEQCICPAVVKPVCGTDGYTYSNECELGCDNKRRLRLRLPLIAVANEGRCVTPPNCGDAIVPVCGTNSITYRNICWLEYHNSIEVSQGKPGFSYHYYGACKTEACNCGTVSDPVCGSDYKTYKSQCWLDCENRRLWALGQSSIKFSYKGECSTCDCQNKPYDPMCASDDNTITYDRTYYNYCYFNCENVRRSNLIPPLPPNKYLYRGQCSPCVCNCPNQPQTCCGFDGTYYRTYYSLCWLNCTSRCYISQGYPGVSFKYYGPCV